MPSGSRKTDYNSEQYKRQLAHSRAWKAKNLERVRRYNREYNKRKRRAAKEQIALGDDFQLSV